MSRSNARGSSSTSISYSISQVSLTFKTTQEDKEMVPEERTNYTNYPGLKKKLGEFQLNVEAGNFAESEILVPGEQKRTGLCKVAVWAEKSASRQGIV